MDATIDVIPNTAIVVSFPRVIKSLTVPYALSTILSTDGIPKSEATLNETSSLIRWSRICCAHLVSQKVLRSDGTCKRIHSVSKNVERPKCCKI